MSDDPPFQPPGQPPEPGGWQPPSGEPSPPAGQPAGVPPAGSPPPPGKRKFSLGGGYSLLGLGGGLLLGLLMPPFVFGLLAATLDAMQAPGWFVFLVPLVAAIAITAVIFVLLARRLDKNDPAQSSARSALLAGGYTALGFYVVASLLVGACFALLASAY